MKPTQQEIIDVAREAGISASIGRTIGGKYHPNINALGKSVPVEWLERLLHLALERFGAGGGEPVNQWRKVGTSQWWDGFPDHSDGGGPYETRTLYTRPSPTSGGNPTGYLVGHSGEYHYFRHRADAEREKAEQERCSGESCGDVEPVFRHPSPTALRGEYLRGLEDAKKICEERADVEDDVQWCVNRIQALKDRQ